LLEPFGDVEVLEAVELEELAEELVAFVLEGDELVLTLDVTPSPDVSLAAELVSFFFAFRAAFLASLASARSVR